jgi:hypothetical protein
LAALAMALSGAAGLTFAALDVANAAPASVHDVMTGTGR